MKACVLTSPRNVEVAEVNEPVVKRGWVLVRVKLAGICGTDIAMYLGRYRPRKLPLIPGHEVVGIIEDVGPEVPRSILGRKVTFEINVVCHECEFCRLGLYTHCANRKAIGIDLDGGFAKYVAVPFENIYFVDDIPEEEAVFAEPLAAVLRAVATVKLNRGWNVVVLGQGPLGYIAAKVFKIHGFRVLVIGKSKYRLSFFEKSGIETINLSEVDVTSYVRKWSNGLGADIVFEATGSPAGANLAIDLARPGGIILAKSTHGLDTSIDYTKLVVKEIALIGSRCGTRREWKRAIELLREDSLKLREIITHIFPLTEAKSAFEVASSKQCMKVVIRP